MGDPQTAKATVERALTILENVNGAAHPTVAWACGNLGSVMQDLKQLAAARQYFERALQIDETFYGPTHANIAGRAMQLGQVLRLLGDNEGARALFERSSKILATTSQLKPPAPDAATELKPAG